MRPRGDNASWAKLSATRDDVRIVDVAPGLWIWRTPHPEWTPPGGVDRTVTSTCVTAGGEIAVLDPLAPPATARDAWERLDLQRPTLAIVLKPDRPSLPNAMLITFIMANVAFPLLAVSLIRARSRLGLLRDQLEEME